LGFGDEGVFRDLDHEARRISGRLKRLCKRAHEVRIAVLLRRDVDADGGIGAEAFVDEIDRLDDLRQHQMSKLVDQSELHRQIDECAGGLNDTVVVAQPYQRLDALDILGPDVDFRLKGAAKAFFQNGQPQRLLDLHSRESLVLHAGVEKGHGALAVVLDAIHRDIGVLTQLIEASAVLGIEADPDRSGYENFRSIDEKRSPQPLQDEVDVFRHLMFALDWIEQQQEFVAADPRQHVGFAQVQPDPLCDFHQQRIPDRMPVIVVDLLEIVDVEKCEGEPRLRFVALQKMVGAMFNQTA